jgi:RimJ/RimL family protein N-acetyltransferase
MLKESKLFDAPTEVPVIQIPDSEDLNFPIDLESWHQLGHRIAFAIGDASFTQFTAADTDALFEIRNHPTVTPFMPSAQSIPYGQHVKWVESTLLAKTKETPLILVGRVAGQPIGFGILKPTAEAGTLEIGVIVAGMRQRNSLPPRLGSALIAVAAQLFGARTLVSFVNQQHKDALRLNRGAGLILMDSSSKPGEFFFRTPIEIATSTPIYRRCARDLRISLYKG